MSWDNDNKYLRVGFPLGIFDREKDQAFLYNHVVITISYYKLANGKENIVKFIIKPFSLQNNSNDGENMENEEPFRIEKNKKLIYSYSIIWIEEPNLIWKDRWNSYVLLPKKGLHFSSLIISGTVLATISFVTLGILIKVLRSNIRDRERIGFDELRGWKDLDGDVFRPPSKDFILAPLVANGIQITSVFLLLISKKKNHLYNDFFHLFISSLFSSN
jgi:hypothetical protein